MPIRTKQCRDCGTTFQQVNSPVRLICKDCGNKKRIGRNTALIQCKKR